jgi:hypothetical protein
VTFGKWALAVSATLGIVALLAGKDDILRYLKMRQM